MNTRRFCLALACVGAGCALVTGSSGYLFRALERRFPIWAESSNEQPAGVIVLGGGEQTFVQAKRVGIAPPGPGQRVTAAVALARRFPNATMVFTGSAEPSGMQLLGAL